MVARAEWPVVDATITIADAIGVVNKGFHMVVCVSEVSDKRKLFPIKSRHFAHQPFNMRRN